MEGGGRGKELVGEDHGNRREGIVYMKVEVGKKTKSP
jgi:hypothetical protein